MGRYKLTGQASAAATITRADGKYALPLLTVQGKDVSGLFYGFKAAGVDGEFQAKKNFADLYALTTAGKVTVSKSVFDKLNMSASWRRGNLYAYIASTELNGVPFKLSLSVNNLKSARGKSARLFIGSIWTRWRLLPPCATL